MKKYLISLLLMSCTTASFLYGSDSESEVESYFGGGGEDNFEFKDNDREYAFNDIAAVPVFWENDYSVNTYQAYKAFLDAYTQVALNDADGGLFNEYITSYRLGYTYLFEDIKEPFKNNKLWPSIPEVWLEFLRWDGRLTKLRKELIEMQFDSDIIRHVGALLEAFVDLKMSILNDFKALTVTTEV